MENLLLTDDNYCRTIINANGLHLLSLFKKVVST